MRRCRAVAAGHPPSVCTDDERPEPDTRPYGRVREDSRGSSRGLPRNLPTITRPYRLLLGPHREGRRPKPMMNDPEKSDSPVVAGKALNEVARGAEEGGAR